VRSCGECNLCCKLEKIENFKPARKWCHHCTIGKDGCGIYETRPSACKNFNCLWKTNEEMPEDMRPDVVRAYAVELNGGVKVVMDPDHVDFKSPVVEWVRAHGYHALVLTGWQLNFVPADGDKPIPEKLVIDWVL
jgi:hypothetical protein